MPRLDRDSTRPAAAVVKAPSALSPTFYPVRLAASVQALIAAVIGLLSVFDVWSPTQDQVSAMMLVYTALLPVIGSIVGSKVTPVAKLNGRQ